MGTFHASRWLYTSTLAILLAALIGFLLAQTRPALAAGAVIDCSRQGLANAMNSGSGKITFNCNNAHTPATITIEQAGGFNVGSNFYAIDGGGIITLTGEDICRVFNLSPGGALTLSNIVLTNGYAGDNVGGAVYVDHGRLVLDHATIQNSHTDNFPGGAIFASGGEVFVQNSLVQGNYNYDYGAINSTGGVTIQNSILRNNTAGSGGGALSLGGYTRIDDSEISGNTAQTGDGGGLYLTGSAYLDMFNSLLSSNVATGTATAAGGGIYSLARMNLTGVALSANAAISAGGGLYLAYVSSLQDVTLRDNTTAAFAGGGGGIYNASSLTMNTVTLDGNRSAGDGGGLLNGDNPGASVTLSNVTFSGNSADGQGGGLSNRNGLNMFAGAFRDNTAPDGGGMDNSGIALLQDVTFSANAATSVGGGIYSGGSLNLNRVTLDHNRASQGAGLFNKFGGSAALVNATLSGNAALSFGGGIFNADHVTLLNVTLSGNAAGVSGGALYGSTANGIAVTNTILAGSAAGGNCAGQPLGAAKYSIDDDKTCDLLRPSLGPGNLHADPLLTALGNYGGPTQVHMPKIGSPAIDGVDGADAPNIDQRGKSRPNPMHGYDIGAVERYDDDSDRAPRLYLPAVRR